MVYIDVPAVDDGKKSGCMNTKVSIIVPAYNCEKYIRECIDSLLKQTYPNIEIIVVDDGSTDKTGDILEEYQGKIILMHQDNMGVCAARNLGIERCSGDYLLFIDSDDYVSDDYVERLVIEAENHQSDLVVCGYALTDSTGEILQTIIPTEYEYGKKEMWVYRITGVCCRLYKREFWDKYRLSFIAEKDARAEDVPIALFANYVGKNICVVPFCGYYYRQHSESAMHGGVSNSTDKVFAFPYKAMSQMVEGVMSVDSHNDSVQLRLGILKLFAQFEYVIFKEAKDGSKEELRHYAKNVLQSLGSTRNIAREIVLADLPVVHKIAMILFYTKIRK